MISQAVGISSSEPVAKEYESGVGDTPGPSQQPNHLPPTAENPRRSKPFEKWEREEMERLLGTLCGHLGENF